MYVYFNYQLCMKDFAVGIKFLEWELTPFFLDLQNFRNGRGIMSLIPFMLFLSTHLCATMAAIIQKTLIDDFF